MELSEIEQLKLLVGEDADLREAYEAHKQYGKKISKLEKKAFLTTDEEVEHKNLKKMKLSKKDEIRALLSRHAAANA